MTDNTNLDVLTLDELDAIRKLLLDLYWAEIRAHGKDYYKVLEIKRLREAINKQRHSGLYML